MSDTKENILMTALCLFAKAGYEAVSVSDIAGELGITKGALYKHYKSKRDIFDSIVKRMYLTDMQRAEEYDVPKEKYEAEPKSYENTSAESIKNFTLAQFTFWTEDEFAANFRKMLVLEQYHDEKMAKLYTDCITAGPIDYMEDIFREMIAKGILQKADSKQLALEFYAPLYLLINIADHSEDKEKFKKFLECHTEQFFRNNMKQKT